MFFNKRDNQCVAVKYFFMGLLGMVFFYSDCIFAAGNQSLKDIALSIMGSFQALGQLMIATAYISGIGFSIAAIFKFKQHKDNPTQIPVSTPIALLGVGVVLIFLPGIIAPVGYTIFGTGAQLDQMAGGYAGDGAKFIPSGKDTP